MRGVFGSQGGRAIPSVRAHVRLRELRVPDEEVRAMSGPDTAYGTILRVLRRRGRCHLREGMQRLRYVAWRALSVRQGHFRFVKCKRDCSQLVELERLL